MHTKTLTLGIAAVIILAVSALVLWKTMPLSNAPLATSTGSGEVACTMEAKLCPDGSYVGREGPTCEFRACPTATSTSEQPAPGTKVTVTTTLGKSVVALGETITPRKVLEDSRCPIDVQCIWAGTVRVDGTVAGGMGLGQLTFELGKTATTEVNAITLVKVEPVKTSTGSIKDGDYRFTFEVIRRGE